MKRKVIDAAAKEVTEEYDCTDTTYAFFFIEIDSAKML